MIYHEFNLPISKNKPVWGFSKRINSDEKAEKTIFNNTPNPFMWARYFADTKKELVQFYMDLEDQKLKAAQKEIKRLAAFLD